MANAQYPPYKEADKDGYVPTRSDYAYMVALLTHPDTQKVELAIHNRVPTLNSENTSQTDTDNMIQVSIFNHPSEEKTATVMFTKLLPHTVDEENLVTGDIEKRTSFEGEVIGVTTVKLTGDFRILTDQSIMSFINRIGQVKLGIAEDEALKNMIERDAI